MRVYFLRGGATVREVKEAPEGGPDLEDLERHLKEASRYKLVIGAFSAASNVTGILTDVNAVTRLLKSYGAYAIWDYAGGGPYLPMDMGRVPEEQKDAIVFSSHKFPGGPGGSGVMVVRDTIVKRRTPIGELILSTPSHRQKSACGVRRTGSAPITALGLSLRHEVCRTRRRARTARQERYKRRN